MVAGGGAQKEGELVAAWRALGRGSWGGERWRGGRRCYRRRKGGGRGVWRMCKSWSRVSGANMYPVGYAGEGWEGKHLVRVRAEEGVARCRKIHKDTWAQLTCIHAVGIKVS